jgi:hypothetical protein
MANRPDALQNWRRSQCSSASVRTTWLYRPDAIQCLTSIRVSASRHSYGKTAATVWTMSSIRQVVHTKFNRPDASLPWSGRAYDRYGNCVQQITRPDGHPLGPDTRSLYKEITCSRHPTVRTTVPHRPNAALKQERSSAKFLNFGRTVVRPNGL